MTKLVAIVCLVAACGGTPAPKPSGQPTSTGAAAKSEPASAAGPNELYDRLGGQRAIVAVVERKICSSVTRMMLFSEK